MPNEGVHPWRRGYGENDAVDEGKLCVIAASARYVVEKWNVVLLER